MRHDRRRPVLSCSSTNRRIIDHEECINSSLKETFSPPRRSWEEKIPAKTLSIPNDRPLARCLIMQPESFDYSHLAWKSGKNGCTVRQKRRNAHFLTARRKNTPAGGRSRHVDHAESRNKNVSLAFFSAKRFHLARGRHRP